ncbi:hypothetical protein Sjap_004714 [Stephania japonica]|uniref:FAS1 domain-containing protein n=1 Tax=Stephania japonica TaxID=461633 RepID=A0AAP0K2P8_9MAGN
MAASPPHLHLPLLLLLQLFPAMIFAAAEPTTTLHASSVSDQQRADLIQALMGAQDLADLAKAFTVSDPSSTFPLTATLFFPKADGEDDKDPILFNNVSLPRFLDPAILGYHIVPQLLSFAELQRFPIGSRLPTLIPDASIVITNNSRFNYAINGSCDAPQERLSKRDVHSDVPCLMYA